jgi:hypothetical protein
MSQLDPSGPQRIRVFVDADACPVKDAVVRVAERHQLRVVMVSNSWMRLPESPCLERRVVPEGPDAADDWIAEHIGSNDIAVTQDIPLAARCLAKGASALSPMGKPFTDANIGMALAMRGLMQELRESSAIKGSNPAFTAKDRSRFLQELEMLVRRALLRAG